MNVFGKGVAYALEQYLNNNIRDFGSVQNLHVYPNEKRIYGELVLKGESGPCKIEVRDYEIESGNDDGVVVIRNLHTSKEWVNIVFKKYYGEIRVPIPKQAAMVAKMVM